MVIVSQGWEVWLRPSFFIDSIPTTSTPLVNLVQQLSHWEPLGKCKKNKREEISGPFFKCLHQYGSLIDMSSVGDYLNGRKIIFVFVLQIPLCYLSVIMVIKIHSYIVNHSFTKQKRGSMVYQKCSHPQSALNNVLARHERKGRKESEAIPFGH